MLDLNRPLHAYDADKIDKGIIVRNSKKGERFQPKLFMVLALMQQMKVQWQRFIKPKVAQQIIR